MIASSIAAGVYDDADHNSTQKSLIDILEPAGIMMSSSVLVSLANVSGRYLMEGIHGGLHSSQGLSLLQHAQQECYHGLRSVNGHT